MIRQVDQFEVSIDVNYTNNSIPIELYKALIDVSTKYSPLKAGMDIAYDRHFTVLVDGENHTSEIDEALERCFAEWKANTTVKLEIPISEAILLRSHLACVESYNIPVLLKALTSF